MPFYVLIPLLGIPVWLGILAYAIALAAKNADAQTRKQLERYEGLENLRALAAALDREVSWFYAAEPDSKAVA